MNDSPVPVQLAVITGGDADLYARLSRIAWRKPVALFDYLPDIAPLLQIADCVISKAGGLVVAEALACGLPLLLVDALPGQEQGNRQYVVVAAASLEPPPSPAATGMRLSSTIRAPAGRPTPPGGAAPRGRPGCGRRWGGRHRSSRA